MRYVSPHPITIFTSYAPEDTFWYEKLETQLAYAQYQQGTIISISRKKAPVGVAYRAFLAEQIDAAQIILLLLSPNFMASEECRDEMEQALQRSQNGSVRLIPIMLDAIAVIDWRETDLGQLNPLPEDGTSIKGNIHPNNALSRAALSIVTLVKTMQQSQQWERPVGYRALSGTPPLVHQMRRVQRPQLVQQIYQTLTGSDVSALALVGMGGIGKSVLAALLYDYAEQQRLTGNSPFTGKTLWLQADATVTLADIVGTLREEWQLPALYLTNMTDEKLLRELAQMLQSAQCLIILNQFEELLDPQTGRARPGISAWLDTISIQPCASRFLLTSRFSPHVTHQATFLHEYKVPPLTVEEGKALFSLYSSEVSESEIRLAVERCQGHALALVLVSQLLKKDSSIRLNDLFEHTPFSLRRIETMADELLQYIFTQQLNQDQRDLLSAFAIYREAVPIEAAQAIVPIFSAMPPERIVRAHTVLLSQYLLQPVGEKRYQSHSLISEFALQKIKERPEQKKPALLQRAHRHAASYYQQQASQLVPSGKRLKGLSGVHNVIEAIWHLCQAKRQSDAYAIITKESLFFDLQRWGSNSILLELYKDLDPSNWRPSPAIAARIHNETGEIYQAIGNWYHAGYHFKLALDGFRALNQESNTIDALNNLGIAYHQQEQIEDALACYKEALRLSEQTQEKVTGSGITLNNLGYLEAGLGHQERQHGHKEKAREHYLQALEFYQQALPLHKAMKNVIEEARTLNNIGEMEQALGKDERAYTYYQQALVQARAQEERWIEATALNNLGVLAKKSEATESDALEYYKQALTIFHVIGARESERIVLNNLGYWYLMQQQHETALAFFVLARNISSELDDDRSKELPRMVLHELRLLLGEQELQTLQHDIETRAKQIVERALLSSS